MRPLRLNTPRKAQITSTGARKGINRRDFSQMLNVEYAQQIQNCRPLADGRLVKVEGYKTVKDFGQTKLGLYDQWGEYKTIYSQGTSLFLHDSRDNTTRIIKDDFRSSKIKGLPYGEYYFVGSDEDVLLRMECRLNVTNKIGSIEDGAIVYVFEGSNRVPYAKVSSSGGSHIVLKEERDKVFIPGQQIEFTNGTTCEVVGIEYYLDRPNNSPYVDCINLVKARLYVGEGDVVHFSNVDSENPPFDKWAATTLADGAGEISYKKAREVVAILPLNNGIIVFQKEGKFAFRHETIDSIGELKRVDISDVNRIDPGGSRACVSTPKGIFYLNESGLWNLITLGINNSPYTEQDNKLSQLLEKDFFFDVDFDSEPDMFYDAGNETIFITLAKKSKVNNLIIAYDTNTGAITEITNWNIGSFFLNGQNFFGTSSLNGKLFKLFDGYSNDGLPINTYYEQEIQLGDLTSRKTLTTTVIQASLHKNTKLEVSFDIYNQHGKREENVVRLLVVPEQTETDMKGWNVLPFNGAWGGVDKLTELISTLCDSNKKIRNAQRIILKISESSRHPYEINYITFEIMEGNRIRKRKITSL